MVTTSATWLLLLKDTKDVSNNVVKYSRRARINHWAQHYPEVYLSKEDKAGVTLLFSKGYHVRAAAPVVVELLVEG